MADVWFTYGNAGAALQCSAGGVRGRDVQDRLADGEGGMKWFPDTLLVRPGGWAYRYGDAPKEGKPQPRELPSLSSISGWKPALGVLVLVVWPFVKNPFMGLALVTLIFVLPYVLLLPLRLAQRWLFGSISPGRACLWPRDNQEEIRRGYLALALKTTWVWLALVGICTYCFLVLRLGMGPEISLSTQIVSGPNSGSPLVAAEFFRMVFVASLIVIVSGLLWLPAILGFEYLSSRRDIAHSIGGAHA
jgi:hypothetical protein